VFTDGSFIKNKTSVKCGYGIHFPKNEFSDVYGKLTMKPETNQRAELFAILQALQIITKKYDDIKIIIYTDSMYSINSLTLWITNWKNNGWKSSTGKSVMNQDLIKAIDEIITSYNGKIKFKHVKAHTKGTSYEALGNEVVDELAKKGALEG
jgi:ribonuclease HI